MSRYLLVALLAPLALPLHAADWPQWMGPNRDGVWAETGVADTLPAGGPKVLWRVPVGGGYSGPAVVGGKLFLTDYQKSAGNDTSNPGGRDELQGQERVFCLDAKTGKELWVHAYDRPYNLSFACGPRCTPTVHAGKVYALGAMGDLLCLDADKGTVLWSKNFPRDYAAKVPMWGFSSHPLVYKNLLICVAGGDGSLAVAFDKDTGKEAWKALTASEPGYAPPTLIEAGGVPQVLIWHGTALNALNPDTGERYWNVPLAPSYAMSIMAPQKAGDLLYAGGLGSKGVCLKLDPAKPAVTEVWKGKRGVGVYAVCSTPMIDGGVLYGADESGAFRAAKLDTGERLWFSFKPTVGKDEEEGFRGASEGAAFLVKNGDRYWIMSETGHLIAAKLSPAGYDEVGRAKLLEPTGKALGRKVVWSFPAFADKCVFARNDKELVCASLAKE